jgi:gamma-glutamyltranspeptidase/glutathione hydrolase
MKRFGFGAVAVALACAALVGVGGASAHPQAQPLGPLVKQPVAYGANGGAATMSPYATAAAIDILKHGGNAVDAAVAAATTLGVTEPFVAGPGGGGYFVYYSARDRKVYAIDGREKAPAGATPDMFLDNGTPRPFETAVESGVSVGVPGQVATWGVAEDRFGSMSMRKVLEPAEEVADRGFPLDTPLVSAIMGQKTKLAHFAPSAAFYLPGGNPPAVGTILRNPDLAETYREIGQHGWRWFYTGPIASELAQTVQHPPTAPGTPAVSGGTMTAKDMANSTAPVRNPVTWSYRGYQLFGMPPSSSGGLTVGEAMNILENFDQSGDRIQALFRYIEASKLAFADRGKYDGDSDFVDVPVTGLLSKDYAKQRAALIGDSALTTPVAPGDPAPFNGGSVKLYRTTSRNHEQHTNHLVVADKWGNVVSYTNTIEQIAGSGILLPHRGFLLNNELTDFNFPTGTANSVQANKRPRSSMSPTIVMKDGHVVEAIGSPGGATIITTVLQTLLNQIDFGMTLPEAIEAPRASNLNGATSAEPSFIAQYGPQLQAKGETINQVAASSPLLPPYIGIAAGLQLLPHGKLETATESWRGGGGSAMVVRPENQDFDESDGW